MAPRSRNAFFAAVVIAAVAAVAWMVSSPRPTPPPFVSPFSPTVTPLPVVVATPVVATSATSATSAAAAAAGRTPETEIAIVRLGVRDYRAAFGSNPVGNNAEVTRALFGDNARKAGFLDPAEVTVNPAGELIDRWGHPYFFHAMSATMMEIRSAGPDGVLFNADDVVSP